MRIAPRARGFEADIASTGLGVAARMLLVLGLATASVVMVLVLAAGLWKVAEAIFVFWSLHSMPAGFADPAEAALHMALKGIEFLFLAPLPYLLVLGVGEYVQRVTKQADAERVSKQIVEVKLLTVGLMIATLATAMIGEMLSDSGLGLERAGGGALVILALCAFYLCVARGGATKPG